MSQVRVKVCGITNRQDAAAAADCGADYLGFIFYPPSKRSIAVAEARQIVWELRQRDDCPLLVGVFVNETTAYIIDVLAECRLDLAQLSGEEVPFLVADSASTLYGRAYKGIRPASPTEAEVEAEWFAVPDPPPHLPSLLIDTFHPILRGGSGQTGDWALSATIARKYPGMMLAGGLTAVNIAEAIQAVKPYAVDVASGVEASPGKKDHDLVRAFVASAKSQSI